MMETTLHHHESRPLTARAIVLKSVDKVYLTFRSADDNEVHIALPHRMSACVAMIVEAFNAHISELKIDPVAAMLESAMRSDEFPTGSAVRTADAIHLAQAFAALTDDDAMDAVEQRGMS